MLDVREPDKGTISLLTDAIGMAREYAARGPCWTLWNGETPVACAGIIVLWTGVAEAWALTSPLVSQFPIGFHRAAKQVLSGAMYEYKLHRLQVSIPSTHSVSCNWIRSLGFQFEGRMEKYGPAKDDWLRFVRLSEWAS